MIDSRDELVSAAAFAELQKLAALSSADSIPRSGLKSRNRAKTADKVSEIQRNTTPPNRVSAKRSKAHGKWGKFALSKRPPPKRSEAPAKVASGTLGRDDLCDRCHWVSDAELTEHGSRSARVRERELLLSGFVAGDCGWHRRCESCLSLAGVTGLLDAEWKPKHGMTVWPRGTDGFVQTTAKELAL